MNVDTFPPFRKLLFSFSNRLEELEAAVFFSKSVIDLFSAELVFKAAAEMFLSAFEELYRGKHLSHEDDTYVITEHSLYLKLARSDGACVSKRAG